MLIVVTTGQLQSGWEEITPVLQCIGLETDNENISQWKGGLLKEFGEFDWLHQQAQVEPSAPLGEQALDLFSELPGPTAIVDSRNLWLLEFWSRIAPQANFILFYRSAKEALANAMALGEEPASYINAWSHMSQQILQFQRKHRKKTLIINFDDAIRYPDAVLRAFGHMGVVLQAVKPWPAIPEKHNPLLDMLSEKFIENETSIQTLQMELEASAYPLTDTAVSRVLNADEVFSDYRSLLQIIGELKKEVNIAEKRQKDLEKERNGISNELEQANKAIQGEIEKRNKTIKENELLRLQLQQVQDELVSVFAVKNQYELDVDRLTKEQLVLQRKIDVIKEEAVKQKEELNKREAKLRALNEEVAKRDAEKARLESAITAVEREKNEIISEKNALEGRLTNQVQSKEVLIVKSLEEIKELEAKLAHSRNACSSMGESLKETTEENNLIKLQLSQAQDELGEVFQAKLRLDGDLEAYAKQNEALKNSVEVFKTQVSGLKKELTAADSVKKSLEGEIAKHLAERDALRSKCDQQKVELKSALDERDKARAELKSAVASSEQVKKDFANKKAQLEEQLKKAVQSREEIQKKSDAETQRLTEELAKAHALVRAAEAAEVDTKEENKLVLLQLNQVNDELEYYFRKSQELDVGSKNIDMELQERHPEFCTTKGLTVLGGEQKGVFRNLNCLLNDLQQGGRSWAKVNIKLLDNNGKPGLEFRKGDKELSVPLTRWVASGKDKAGAYMVLRPSESEAKEQLLRMPASDWLLITGLADLLAFHLRTGGYTRDKKAEQIEIGRWCEVARDLRKLLRDIEPAFRFDGVKLRETNVSSSYEHLWLEFTNAQYGERAFPVFGFKLAAKGVKGEKFTQNSAFVFRSLENGKAPLEAWPPVQADRFGPILQLEFSSELSDTQKAVWSALTTSDQQFMSGVIARLPEIIDQLENSGIHLKRPWQQWKNLVVGMKPYAPTVVISDTASIENPNTPVAEETAGVVSEITEVPKSETNAVDVKDASKEKIQTEKPVVNNSGNAGAIVFTDIDLGEVNTRSDYEHIRIDYKNLTWGPREFANYSVKLAALDVREGKFTGRLMLVFRNLEEGVEPLECWSRAKKDKYGSVVRLAFGGLLSDDEQSDWACLTENDRAFVNGLLLSMPDVLHLLKKKNNSKKVKRNWADWQQLVQQQIGVDESTA